MGKNLVFKGETYKMQKAVHKSRRGEERNRWIIYLEK